MVPIPFLGYLTQDQQPMLGLVNRTRPAHGPDTYPLNFMSTPSEIDIAQFNIL